VIKNKTLKNIFLIGFMGAGKTSVGRILAKKLRLGFQDLDEVIEKELRMNIPQIFSNLGEDFFRDAESNALRSLSQEKNQVIATGGGVVLREENREVMRREGITIYLKASPEVLWNRVRGTTSRPLLQVENPFEKMCELLSKRAPLYEKADLIVDTENMSPEGVAEEIIKIMKRFSFIG
jgi:shikimate kinase